MHNKEYRDERFKSDEEFLKTHQEKAKQGDEISKSILNTRSRILLAELARARRERDDVS